MVPGNNSKCVVMQSQTAYEVYVPRYLNNSTAGRVKWYRSLDLTRDEEIINEYEVQNTSTSLPTNSSASRLYGLFRYFYSLIIRNTSSSDEGYYKCRIIHNKSCLSFSP